MTCDDVVIRLDALRTGELSTPDRRHLETHLTGCAACRAVRTELDALAGAMPSPGDTPSIWPAVESALFHGLARLEVTEPVPSAWWVAFSPAGVTTILPATVDRADFEAGYRRRFDRDLVERPLPERFRRHILAALRGEAPSDAAVDLSGLGGLERRVLEELRRIPKGQVRPYGWIAARAGRPRAARAVGTVCARNPVPFLVPCHRVVPATGAVGNYAFGPAMKRDLLTREGVPVAELERLADAGVRYVGSRTTGIFCFPTCPDARRIREPNRIELHDEQEARAAGMRACQRCQPAAAA